MYIFNNYEKWVTIFRSNDWLWNIYSHTYIEKSWFKWNNLSEIILIFKKFVYEKDRDFMTKHSTIGLNKL